MRRLRTRLAPFLALAASACTWGAPDGPSLLAVTPAEALNDADTLLSIRGTGFDPELKADFDRPGQPAAGGGFTATLIAGASRVPLGPVTRLSSTELHATLPARATPGIYDVEVRDERGNVAALPSALRVLELVTVTTAVDENDPGATPAAPLGTGLSLREAIAWVNGRGLPALIRLTGPMTVTMTPPQTAMTLTAAGAVVAGTGDVVLDFGEVNQNCFTLGGPGQRLQALTLRGCTGTFVAMNAGGQQVTAVNLQVSPASVYVPWGILAQSTSTTWSRIGPGNVVSGTSYAVYVKGANYEIAGNRLTDGGGGALLKGGAARIWGNTFTRMTTAKSNKGVGVTIQSPTGPVEILHNTFDANGGNAVDGTSLAGLTVRNNLFTSGLGVGLAVSGAPLAHDHNGYFGNAGGAVTPPLAAGATDLLLDPLYVNASTGDYHLQAASPVIDKGIDTGLDVNGAAPGLFNGAAPDLGAFEAP